ncbi:pentapeptide repeat-containing protein [Aneurinibacillus danicus]|jgi:uncharacterized protein YjbI with pentapeptide repeats|uniref:Pentapeptide repeat-containing protein n=1 Tax=Aneurinibacillus danicus TaxID=267746 RepID=A0A511V2N5_9BACL|nr:pentapeptide repeat-containing protein [Aneurinibacillus danicus]GEN33177.1 hypothetical protein ADA01nite_06370 [Aneurinibacillus danicus]
MERLNKETLLQILRKEKFLYEVNLEGLDLSTADFTGVDIEGANLHGTGAKIEYDG